MMTKNVVEAEVDAVVAEAVVVALMETDNPVTSV